MQLQIQMQTNYGEKYKLVHIFVQSGSTTIAWQSSRVQLNQSGKSVIHHIPLQCKWWIHLSQLSLVHCAKPFWACMTQPGLYDWIEVKQASSSIWWMGSLTTLTWNTPPKNQDLLVALSFILLFFFFERRGEDFEEAWLTDAKGRVGTLAQSSAEYFTVVPCRQLGSSRSCITP